MRRDPILKKAKGSVWRTHEDAQTYLEKTSQDYEFKVYAVEADWERDAIPVSGVPWRELQRPCRLRSD